MKYMRWVDLMPSVKNLQFTLFYFLPTAPCHTGTPSKLSKGARVFSPTVCPAGCCVIFKWMWVVVLWLGEITDLWLPNHGRRPAAPQAIERLQTASLSSTYIQRNWGESMLQFPTQVYYITDIFQEYKRIENSFSTLTLIDYGPTCPCMITFYHNISPR